MCAIVDVNNCHKIFGNLEQRTPAGRYFLDWLEGASGRLILGGTKFNSEIGKVGHYINWLKTAARTGHAHRVKDHLVDTAERETSSQRCVSIGRPPFDCSRQNWRSSIVVLGGSRPT